MRKWISIVFLSHLSLVVLANKLPVIEIQIINLIDRLGRANGVIAFQHVIIDKRKYIFTVNSKSKSDVENMILNLKEDPLLEGCIFSFSKEDQYEKFAAVIELLCPTRKGH